MSDAGRVANASALVSMRDGHDTLLQWWRCRVASLDAETVVASACAQFTPQVYPACFAGWRFRVAHVSARAADTFRHTRPLVGAMRASSITACAESSRHSCGCAADSVGEQAIDSAAVSRVVRTCHDGETEIRRDRPGGSLPGVAVHRHLTDRGVVNACCHAHGSTRRPGAVMGMRAPNDRPRW